MVCLGLLMLLGCLARGLLRAQGPTSVAVRGRVVDAGGEGLGEVTVRLWAADAEEDTHEADPEQRLIRGYVAETDRRGEFMLLGLPPGEWKAAVSLPRAMGWVGPLRLVLEAGGVADLQLRVEEGPAGLRLADASDGDAGGVSLARGPAGGASETGSSSGAGAAGAVLRDLPLEDRQWEAVEALSSAAHDATVAGGGAAQDAVEEGETAAARSEGETGSAASGLSFDGLPATQNAQVVDGLSAEQSFGAGPRGASASGGRLGSSFAQGGVNTLKVMPRTFSAQYGGAAGGVVTVSSRGAGERLHGSVFAQDRESAWAAVNPYAVVTRYGGGAVNSYLERPPDTDVQFGGAVGAPLAWPGGIRRLRMGVFGAFEAQDRLQTMVSSPETAGFFQLSPTQVALLENRGVGAGAIKGALDYLDSLMGSVVVTTPRALGFGRLDLAPGEANRVSLGVQVQRGSGPVTGGSQFSEGVFDHGIADLGRSEVQAEAYTAQWQHGFGTRAVNSVRAQVAGDLQFETPGTPAAGEPAIGPGRLVPQVSIQPEGFVYGTPAALGRLAYPDERRVEVGETFGLRFGRHLLTMGGDWSRVRDTVLSATNLEGAFLYDSDDLDGHAGGLADWITDYTFNVHAYPNGGCPSIYSSVHDFCFRSYAQTFLGAGAATSWVTHQVSGFAEDALRLGRGLRVSLGVRYDYLLLPFPQTPNPALDAQLAVLGGPQVGTTNTFPEDRNNVGPRASVAWSPGARRRWFTVQAGYGFFYGRLPGATVNAALTETALPSSETRIRILPTTETQCPQVTGINQGFGYPCAFLSEPTGVAAQTTSALVFAKGFRLPATQRGEFALERGFGRQLLLRGAYATAWTTQLPESVDLNIAPSTGNVSYVIEGGDGPGESYKGLHTGQTFQVPGYTARRMTAFGPVTALVSNANATYHSGTAEVRLRGFRGWSVWGSYTFSRAIDYGPQSSPAPRGDGQFDPFSDGYDKGLSSLQFPQHFAGDLSFASSWRGGNRELRAVASGWRFAAIGTAGSGAPYSYGVFGGTRLAGGHESINGSGGATYLPTVGRNTLRLPPRGMVNLRSARELPVRGRVRLELQADAFNLLNSVSLSRVETRAFLLGTQTVTPSSGTASGPIPLVFQDAAAIAAEGLTVPAFGTPLSSTSGGSRERQVQLGARIRF